jgi:CDP-6-deoxy-D-xylo-4-hexulose-3-dehydrase
LDLQGALGLAQLRKLDQIHDLRKKYKDEIQNILSSIKGIRFPTKYLRAEVSWFGVPVICDSLEIKTKLVNYLENNRIQTRNYFAGNILIHPGFKEFGNWKDYPNANQVLERVFFIGCSPTMSEENIEYIRDVIKKYI